jgi:tetratricopeptide (TPR) repeat protein
MLSYYIDYNLWSLNPAGLRLSNLILHLFNSILVFYLLLLLFKDKVLAQASSILFLVHPVQISTVAYISARGDLLSGFFILTCCILFLKFLDSLDYRLYSLSILSAAFALLSRENALLIIFFLILLSSIGLKQKFKFKYLTGFLALAATYFTIRFIVFGPSGIAAHPVYLNGLLLRLVNFCNIIFHYSLLILWPQNLRMLHSIAFIYKLTIPIIFLASLGIILFLALLVGWRKKKLVVFSLLWFCVGVSPVYFYFDAYPALGSALMAESWLYLPSIGFFTALAGICRLNKKGLLIIIAWVLILGCIVLANQVHWRNDVVFYERVMQFLPEDNLIQKKLADAYIAQGNFSQAQKSIKKLQKYYPDSAAVSSCWAQYYLAIGQPNEALNYYQRLLGKSFFSNYSVSLCYSRLGDLDRAIAFSQVSFNQNALYLPNIIQLATLYKASGQKEQANKYFILAGQLDPKNMQHLIK